MNSQEILKKRAQLLAKPYIDRSAQNNNIDAIKFHLADELYAIESLYIQEIYPIKDVTFLPNVPDFVYGVINVRRKIISIIDLKKLFGMPAHRQDPKNKAIILENDFMQFGILADEVEGVTKIKSEELIKSLPTLSGVRKEFLKGITTDHLIVLCGEKLLMSPVLQVKEKLTV